MNIPLNYYSINFKDYTETDVSVRIVWIVRLVNEDEVRPTVCNFVYLATVQRLNIMYNNFTWPSFEELLEYWKKSKLVFVESSRGYERWPQTGFSLLKLYSSYNLPSSYTDSLITPLTQSHLHFLSLVTFSLPHCLTTRLTLTVD